MLAKAPGPSSSLRGGRSLPEESPRIVPRAYDTLYMLHVILSVRNILDEPCDHREVKTAHAVHDMKNTEVCNLASPLKIS